MADQVVNGNGKQKQTGVFHIIKDIIVILGIITGILYFTSVKTDIAVLQKEITYMGEQVKDLVNIHPRTQGGVMR